MGERHSCLISAFLQIIACWWHGSNAPNTPVLSWGTCHGHGGCRNIDSCIDDGGGRDMTWDRVVCTTTRDGIIHGSVHTPAVTDGPRLYS